MATETKTSEKLLERRLRAEGAMNWDPEETIHEGDLEKIKSPEKIISIGAPGSEVVKLPKEWENDVYDFIEKERKDYTAFGKELAKKAGITPDKVLEKYPDIRGETNKILISFHTDLIKREYVPHGCGANASDLTRAIMMAFAEAAILVWAIEESGLKGKEVEIVLFRTEDEEVEAGFGRIRNDGDLVNGTVEENYREDIDYYPIPKPNFYEGEKRPTVRDLETLLIGLNRESSSDKNLPVEQMFLLEDGRIVVVTCIDDRVKFKIDGKTVEISKWAAHKVDSLHVSVGQFAAYRSTAHQKRFKDMYNHNTGAGLVEITSDNANEIVDDIVSTAILTFAGVISNKFEERHLYLDFVANDEGEYEAIKEVINQVQGELLEKLKIPGFDLSKAFIKTRIAKMYEEPPKDKYNTVNLNQGETINPS